MADPDLLARLGELEAVSLHGPAWRHVRPEYPPLSGEGARLVGGRWNPPESYPTLYLGLNTDVVTAEFNRHLARQGLRPRDALSRILYRYEVGLCHLLDLREPATRHVRGSVFPATSPARPRTAAKQSAMPRTNAVWKASSHRRPQVLATS